MCDVLFEDGTDLYWARFTRARISESGAGAFAAGRGRPPGSEIRGHGRGLGLVNMPLSSPQRLGVQHRSWRNLRVIARTWIL